MLTPVEAVISYIEDIEYQYGRGLGCLNFCTAGTPYFGSKEEAEEYILQLKALVLNLKASQS